MRKLTPRATTGQAVERLHWIEGQLKAGVPVASLVEVGLGDRTYNATGGAAPTDTDLHRWRSGVIHAMSGVSVGSPDGNQRRTAALGRAVSEVIDPSPSDAAHDGGWSFLTLWMFPDIVHARWSGSDGTLPVDRWIGAQAGRDRNDLKLAYRRWRIFGDLLLQGSPLLGEDELVALTERSALARNQRVVRVAARQILQPGAPENRSAHARELMKAITYRTGPLILDLLSDKDLTQLVGDLATEVAARRKGGSRFL